MPGGRQTLAKQRLIFCWDSRRRGLVSIFDQAFGLLHSVGKDDA